MTDEESIVTHESTYEAMVAVMREIDAIAKSRQADSSMGGYSFRGYEDALEALAPACRKHGLLAPIKTGEAVQREYVTKGGSVMHWWSLPVEVHFCGGPDDYIVAGTEGEAADTGDKAVSKAVSVAYREIMFKTFVIPVLGMNYDTEGGDEDKAAGRPNERTDEEVQALGWSNVEEAEDGWLSMKTLCQSAGESGEWARAWAKATGIKRSTFSAGQLSEMEVTMANAKKDGDWKANYTPPEIPA